MSDFTESGREKERRRDLVLKSLSKQLIGLQRLQVGTAAAMALSSGNVWQAFAELSCHQERNT